MIATTTILRCRGGGGDGVEDKAATVLKAAACVLRGIHTRDDAAAALQSLVAVRATAGPPATRTGEFYFIIG